jgi:hypothetical protein
MNRTCIFVMAVACTIIAPMSGCVPDTAEPEPGPCGRKATACHNSCYKIDLGVACHSCCDRNFISCKDGRGYQFYSCPEKE